MFDNIIDIFNNRNVLYFIAMLMLYIIFLIKCKEKNCVLSDLDIIDERFNGNIVIEPFKQEQLSNSSYDCTLGCYYYKINKNYKSHYFNPWNEEMSKDYWELEFSNGILVESEEDAKKYGCSIGDQCIILEPGSTILGHTNEFIGGKNNITSMMKCRSSLGRSDVSCCLCSGWGDIGFTNRYTMEIRNHSNIPIVLLVGQKVAQIVFFRTGLTNNPYYLKGNYQNFSPNDFKDIINTWNPIMMLPKLKRI